MGRLIQQYGCRFLQVVISSKSVCLHPAYHSLIEFASKSPFYILPAHTSRALGSFNSVNAASPDASVGVSAIMPGWAVLKSLYYMELKHQWISWVARLHLQT